MLASAETGDERPRLRLQLLLLTGVTTLPLILLLAYNVHREANRDVEAAAESAQNVARLIATDAARMVRDTRVTAEALAQLPEIRALDPDRCTPLRELTRLLPYVANAMTARRDGEVVCTALPLPSAAHGSAAPVFQGLVPTGRSTVGQLAQGPISGRWVVPIAAVLRNPDGSVDGTLVLSVDVARLSPPEPPASAAPSFVSLIDGLGNVLMRSPDDGSVGANDGESMIVRTALREIEGHGRARGPKGHDQIFGFTRVEGSDWIAISALPASAALAASRESAARSAILGALIVLFTGVVAYIVGRRVERPMRAIAVAARSVAEGDLAVRAPVAGSRETADVAAQLNRLLDRLPQIEQQLRESEKRLSLVLGAAHEGIVVSDVEQRITFANEAAARLLGFDEAADLVGQRVQDVLVDLDAAGANRLAERTAGRADRFELRIRARDAVQRWLFVSSTPVRSDTGRIEGSLAMLYDVTERKDVEERLARVTRLYWALSEVNEAIVRTTDRTTLFGDACRIVVEEGGFVSAFVTMLDRERQLLSPAASAGAVTGVLGCDPISLAPGGPHAGSVLAFAVMQGEPQVVNDYFADPRTLPARPIAASLGIRASAAFPLRCEGRVVGALAVFAADTEYFDIGLTELLRQVADDVSFALDVYERAAARDRAEAAVRELNADLERHVAERTARLTDANQDLESFSYSVSHDLRAPVRAINGFAHLLAAHAGAALDEEGTRLLGNIIRSSAHMGRLIDDLLAFAQLGRSALDLRPVALAPLIERLVEQLQPQIDGCHAQVSVTPLPLVRGDPTLLEQIFANLLGNALEYRRPGIPPRIDVSWQDAGERVAIAVRDNGIGIAPEHHARIFEMFVRLHPASAHPGTGIGLAIAARAAALMQGEITVESRADEGATFRVFLARG